MTKFTTFTTFSLQRIERTIAKQRKSSTQEKQVKQAQANLDPRLFPVILQDPPNNPSTTSLKSRLKSILGRRSPYVERKNSCPRKKKKLTLSSQVKLTLTISL